MPLNYDALLATTLSNYEEKLVDNIFSKRALSRWLIEKGRLKRKSGGVKIVEPLIYAANSTVGSYSGYDTLSTTAQDGISAAEYSWKQYAGTIAINGLEEAQNNGEEEVLDLLSAKVMQAEESMTEGMNTMFFLDGTGNSGKDWLGLAAFVSTSVVVGSIDPATYTWWQAGVDTTTAALTITDLNHQFNTVSVGGDVPDVEFTTQLLFEKYESLLNPQLRYTDTKSADAGFQNLMHKTAPVFWDGACQSGTWYFLNSKYLAVVGHTDKWFKQSEWVKPTNQDARFAQIFAYGNMVCSNRKRQGKLTNRS